MFGAAPNMSDDDTCVVATLKYFNKKAKTVGDNVRTNRTNKLQKSNISAGRSSKQRV